MNNVVFAISEENYSCLNSKKLYEMHNFNIFICKMSDIINKREKDRQKLHLTGEKKQKCMSNKDAPEKKNT